MLIKRFLRERNAILGYMAAWLVPFYSVGFTSGHVQNLVENAPVYFLKVLFILLATSWLLVSLILFFPRIRKIFRLLSVAFFVGLMLQQYFEYTGMNTEQVHSESLGYAFIAVMAALLVLPRTGLFRSRPMGTYTAQRSFEIAKPIKQVWTSLTPVPENWPELWTEPPKIITEVDRTGQIYKMENSTKRAVKEFTLEVIDRDHFAGFTQSFQFDATANNTVDVAVTLYFFASRKGTKVVADLEMRNICLNTWLHLVVFDALGDIWDSYVAHMMTRRDWSAAGLTRERRKTFARAA